MKKNGEKNKVFVGLSGGVDSAVSACLLKQAGYEVTGVFIKVWQPDWIECNWKEERRDAMRVAAYLDIPFITLDLVNEYKTDVIDYMIREYGAGRTPNPDVMCNRYVKFGGFLKWAKEQGADFVATGHYARLDNIKDERLKIKNDTVVISDTNIVIPDTTVVIPAPSVTPAPSVIPAKAGIKDPDTFRLLAGTDKNKDQSYFLWTLNQRDLPFIKFPVGHLTKEEVRKLADKFGLPNARKKDSQGLCFIGKVNVKEFLSHYIKSEKGNVLNENGEIIGTHPGALFFTKGERHGFSIIAKTPNDKPFYVVDKDVEQNTITVSNKENDGILPMAEKLVTISNVNWVSGHIPEFDPDKKNYFPLLGRARYRQQLQKIRIVSANVSEVTFEFEKPQDTLSSGQSLVIYDGEECLGGGAME